MQSRGDIEVFDLDGTLTYTHAEKPYCAHIKTNSLTVLVMYEVIAIENREKFLAAYSEYEIKNKKNYTDYAALKKLFAKFLEYALSLVSPEDATPDTFKTIGKNLTFSFLRKGLIHPKALVYINRRLSDNVSCVISTASLQDIAEGFLQALHEEKIFSYPNQDTLLVSGTTIDWGTKEILHLNMLDGKCVSLSDFRITRAFADNPRVYDLHLLCAAAYPVVISTPKNHSEDIPAKAIRSNWTIICSNDRAFEDFFKVTLAKQRDTLSFAASQAVGVFAPSLPPQQVMLVTPTFSPS